VILIARSKLNRNRVIGAYFAGQLGNQLFQRAAAEFLALSSGNVSVQICGILGRDFPKSPALSGIRYTSARRFENKICGFLIGQSTGNRTSVISNIALFIAKRVLQLILIIRFRRKFTIYVSNSIFEAPLVEHEDNAFLVGYFQNYFWSLRENEIRAKICHMLQIPEKVTLIPRVVMHVRLTDYLETNDFGQLSPSYYAQVLQLARDDAKPSELIITTDDKHLAEKMFTGLNHSAVFYGKEELSSLEALHMIRESKYRVIANSSFSWWAAYLGEAEESRTFFPSPWFRHLNGINRFPREWIPCDAIWIDDIN